MALKAFRLASLISLVLFCVSLCAFLVSYSIDPAERRLSLAENFHLSLWNGRVVIFNDDHGPYRGGILFLTDDKGSRSRKLQKEVYWGDTAGIYFRYFQWPKATLWTLKVSCLWPMGLCLILPAGYALVSWRRNKKARRDAPRELA
jgi:hypothetical protein